MAESSVKKVKQAFTLLTVFLDEDEMKEVEAGTDPLDIVRDLPLDLWVVCDRWVES